MLLVLSPHLDDAVLSAGETMQGWPSCTVLTLCTGVPEDASTLTTYDANSGFATAAEAMRRRAKEDHDALAHLNARGIHGGLLDNQYRAGAPFDVERGLIVTLGVIEAVSATHLLGPVGLAHPDHEGTAEVMRQVLERRPELEAWLYEDHPSSVLYPDHVPLRLDWWDLMGWTPALGFLGHGDIDLKGRAVGRYRSQGWALNHHAVMVPERLHRLTHHDDQEPTA